MELSSHDAGLEDGALPRRWKHTRTQACRGQHNLLKIRCNVRQL